MGELILSSSTNSEVKVINGFHGGQVTRIAIGLAAILGEEIRIVRIRENRPNPGLRPQHLNAVLAVAKLCNAEVEGAKVGSRELIFKPGKLEKKKINVNIGTAGSISLVFQALLTPAFLKGAEILAKGGTDVPLAPPIDYLRLVTLPTLELFGFKASIEVIKRGYYPKGGGEALLEVKPGYGRIELLEPVEAEIKGISHATNLPGVAERMKKALLKFFIGREIKIKVEHYSCCFKGCAIVIGKPGVGGSALGRRGLPAEKVAEAAAREFLSQEKEVLDKHMSDQVLPFIAVYGGKAKIQETDHVRALLKMFREIGLEFSYENNIFSSEGVV